MLVIKCSACKSKRFKDDQIGAGSVLRCPKKRIIRVYDFTQNGDRVFCRCSNLIGIHKEQFIKMIDRGFVRTGTNRHRK